MAKEGDQSVDEEKIEEVEKSMLYNMLYKMQRYLHSLDADWYESQYGFLSGHLSPCPSYDIVCPMPLLTSGCLKRFCESVVSLEGHSVQRDPYWPQPICSILKQDLSTDGIAY